MCAGRRDARGGCDARGCPGCAASRRPAPVGKGGDWVALSLCRWRRRCAAHVCRAARIVRLLRERSEEVCAERRCTRGAEMCAGRLRCVRGARVCCRLAASLPWAGRVPGWCCRCAAHLLSCRAPFVVPRANCSTISRAGRWDVRGALGCARGAGMCAGDVVPVPAGLRCPRLVPCGRALADVGSNPRWLGLAWLGLAWLGFGMRQGGRILGGMSPAAERGLTSAGVRTRVLGAA